MGQASALYWSYVAADKRPVKMNKQSNIPISTDRFPKIKYVSHLYFMLAGKKFLPLHIVSKINDTRQFCNRKTVKTNVASGISKTSLKYLTNGGSYHYFVRKKIPSQ